MLMQVLVARVPLIGESLVIFVSLVMYRQQDVTLLVPLTRDDNLNWDWNIRLNSDLTKSMKLAVAFFSGKQYSQAQKLAFYDSSKLGERLVYHNFAASGRSSCWLWSDCTF